jgi:hypothetical protein
MGAEGKLAGVNKNWVGGCLFALFFGAGLTLVLSSPRPNPILSDLERFRLVPQIAHYVFQPLTYVAVAALLTFRVIRMRYVGFWSILFSFIVGGISATILLTLK